MDLATVANTERGARGKKRSQLGSQHREVALTANHKSSAISNAREPHTWPANRKQQHTWSLACLRWRYHYFLRYYAHRIPREQFQCSRCFPRIFRRYFFYEVMTVIYGPALSVARFVSKLFFLGHVRLSRHYLPSVAEVQV